MVLRIPVILLLFACAASRWISFLFLIGYITPFKQALRKYNGYEIGIYYFIYG